MAQALDLKRGERNAYVDFREWMKYIGSVRNSNPVFAEKLDRERREFFLKTNVACTEKTDIEFVKRRIKIPIGEILRGL